MKWFSVLFIFISYFSFSQVDYSYKAADFFTINEIQNKDRQFRFILSATLDEAGFLKEKCFIKNEILSFESGLTFKRLLPNFSVWNPLTLESQPFLPRNGLLLQGKLRWYFNARKFAFTGFRIYSGLLWTGEREMNNSISFLGNSRKTVLLFFNQSFRAGMDFIVGRKFLNKAISEIEFQLGFRINHYSIEYKCLSYCNINNVLTEQLKGINVFYHFQLLLGFDLFKK